MICADAVGTVNAVVDGVSGVDLDIVYIDNQPDRVPTEVVAVPTYVPDGCITHLGNPGQEWLEGELGSGRGGAGHGAVDGFKSNRPSADPISLGPRGTETTLPFDR